LWDLSDGKCIYTFEGHKGAVNAVYLSADGKWAMTAGDDKSIRLWTLDWELDIPASGWDDEADEVIKTSLENIRPYGNKVINILSSKKGSGDLSMNDNYAINDEDYLYLQNTLDFSGYGWIKNAKIREKAEELIQPEKKQPDDESD
jgi:WD40 repeat protein